MTIEKLKENQQGKATHKLIGDQKITKLTYENKNK
jgi:hypothetical protein